MKQIIVRSGHVSSGLMVGRHQQLEVQSGGLVVDTNLLGSMTVDVGGVGSGTTVSSGGYEAISGGAASGSLVLRGGLERLFDGMQAGKVQHGMATGTILSGGEQDVGPHTRAVSTWIGSDAVQYVASTGLANQTIVASGGLQQVEAGNAVNVSLEPGAREIDVFIGANVKDITVHAGAFEFVGSGAASTGLVQSGGTLVLLPGAKQGGMTVAAGGDVVTTGVVLATAHTLKAAPVLEGGVAYRGTEYVLPGGSAVSASVVGLGNVSDSIGGVGGAQVVYSGGTAVATQVSNGGFLELIGGGSVASAVLLSGGVLAENAGNVQNLTVTAGAAAYTYSGQLEGADVAGRLTDYGGQVSGVTVQSGGMFAIVTSSPLPDDTIIHAGGVCLLESFEFVSGSQSAVFNSTTDVLTISSINDSVSLQLAGSYAGDRFVLTGGPSIEGTQITVVSGGAMAVALDCHGRAEAGSVTAILHAIMST